MLRDWESIVTTPPQGKGPMFGRPCSSRARFHAVMDRHQFVNTLLKVSRPLAPVREITGIGIVRTAFGPMHLGFGVSVVDLAYHVRSAVIAVPCNRIGVLAELGVGQRANCASPQVVVVIQDPDLGWHATAFQERAEMVAHKLNLIFLGPDAGR